MLRIFIGIDARQPVAYHVLVSSIQRRASRPVAITPLILEQLPIQRQGLTTFTFSRYLVPYLCGYEGQGLFIDSDMILLDDDFASIVTGIQEGRRIFDNLKKVIAYMISLATVQVAPFFFQFVLGMPLPCNTILLLALPLGTTIFPAIAIGSEEPEIDVMTRLPRKLNEHMVGQIGRAHV
mgnify:CR=1 FL=1